MPKYGNDSLTMKSQEAAKLRSLMTSMRVGELPKPGELHESHADFMRFSHRSFSNVYNNIKKQMTKSREPVPPDSDEEEEEEGEFGVVLLLLTNFSLNSPLLFPLPPTLQDVEYGDEEELSPPPAKTERPAKKNAPANTRGAGVTFAPVDTPSPASSVLWTRTPLPPGSSGRRPPPLPKGCLPLLLPATHFEIEMNEELGGAKYEEIALWGLSGSMAITPKVTLSDCRWFVNVEYDSKRFMDPAFLAGNPNDHGAFYQVILERYRTMVREMTANYTQFPRYIMQIPLRSCQGREIVFEGLHFKKIKFRYGHERERENFDVMRIFVKSDWDDVARKKDSQTRTYRFDSDSDDDDSDEEDYGPKDYRNSPYTTPAPRSNPRSASSNQRSGNRDSMSMVSYDSSNKRPRTNRSSSRHFHSAPTVPMPPSVAVPQAIPAAYVQKPLSPVKVVSSPYHRSTSNMIPIKTVKVEQRQDTIPVADLLSPSTRDSELDWATVFDGDEDDDVTPPTSPVNEGYARRLYRHFAGLDLDGHEQHH